MRTALAVTLTSRLSLPCVMARKMWPTQEVELSAAAPRPSPTTMTLQRRLIANLVLTTGAPPAQQAVPVRRAYLLRLPELALSVLVLKVSSYNMIKSFCQNLNSTIKL